MFELTKQQVDVISAWIAKHNKEPHIANSEAAIGGAYTWCFTPTSLGVVEVVKCACGEKCDVTDYDAW